MSIRSPQKKHVGDLPELDDNSRQQGMRNAIGLLLVTLLLLAFGLNMVYSAASGGAGGTAAVKFFRNQLLCALLGGMGGLAAFALGYKFFCRRAFGYRCYPVYP